MTDLDIIDAEVVEDALSYGDALDGMNALASEARDINEQIARYTERAAFLWSHRAWEVLGHKTWAECVEERGAQLRLPRADRRELVALLDQKGMTTRAIAPVVGASIGTVHADLSSGVQNRTPDAEPRTKTGLDGKTYTTQPRKPATTLRDAGVVDMATGEIYDPATVTPENRAERQAERERMLSLYTDAGIFSQALNRLNMLADPRHVEHYLEVARVGNTRPDFSMKHHNPESIRAIAQHLLNYADTLENQS